MTNISIVIPVFNGEATIGFVVNQLIESLSEFKLEIILKIN